MISGSAATRACPLDELVSFRIHDVSPAFIDELRSSVTSIRSRSNWSPCAFTASRPNTSAAAGPGLKDLTIDKLVAMKIHGID